MEEVRKDIPWYEGLYQVSNIGRVISYCRKKATYLCFWRGNWYYQVDLCKFGERKTIKIHRLVAEAFIDNKNDSPAVNHKDWVRTNNVVDNLERVTYSENSRHAHDILGNITNQYWGAKRVYQLDMEGNLINSRPSQRQAARSLWYNQSWIARCCLGYRGTYKWFIWKI